MATDRRILIARAPAARSAVTGLPLSDILDEMERCDRLGIMPDEWERRSEPRAMGDPRRRWSDEVDHIDSGAGGGYDVDIRD